MSKKVPVIFHNLRGYDSHLLIKEISKFDVKVSVISNGLEKYMAFTINTNLVFIESMQFMNSSLDSVVKICEIMRLIKQKGMYPFEYMDSFKKFS